MRGGGGAPGPRHGNTALLPPPDGASLLPPWLVIWRLPGVTAAVPLSLRTWRASGAGVASGVQCRVPGCSRAVSLPKEAHVTVLLLKDQA